MKMKSVNKFDIIAWSHIVILSLATNPSTIVRAAITVLIAFYFSYRSDKE